MKYKLLSLTALAGAILASPAQAQDKQPKPVSAFVLCDGRTGHVGLMATLGRLVAITATAGLSEAATAKDDDTRKLKGVEAASACDTALGDEHDDGRRVQLAYAKAIHLIEADKLDDALVAARAIDAAGGALATDWGYRRTLEPRILLLQADILARMKKPDETEAAALQALRLAPYDVSLAQRADRYLNLSPTLDAEKDATLAQLARILPMLSWTHAAAQISAGRFGEAEATMAALRNLAVGFFPEDFHPEVVDSVRATLLALNGDGAKSDELAAQIQASLTNLNASGYTTQNGGFVAQITEGLSLRQILRDAMNGHGKDARATFRAHGPWVLVDHALLIAAVAKLREGATPDELTGVLGETPLAMQARWRSERMAALSVPKGIPLLYPHVFYLAKDSEFAHASGATWKVGDKPRFLLKRKADDKAPGEVLSTEPSVSGLPAGEALFLQAALIAKARGVNGFAVAAGRKYVTSALTRYGMIGEPELPALLALDADKVIADLSPHIPQPVPSR